MEFTVGIHRYTEVQTYRYNITNSINSNHFREKTILEIETYNIINIKTENIIIYLYIKTEDIIILILKVKIYYSVNNTENK